MTVGFVSFAAVLSLALVAGCSGAADPSIDDGAGSVGVGMSTTGTTGTTSTGGSISSDDAGADGAAAGDDSDGQASNSSFGQTAVTRATEWVTAKMPYCGGPNGGDDVICGGTCERSGAADQPQWNDYRSDCSGLVSWAWNLPAPGHTTSDFAPYDTSDSHEINGTDLAIGDALNNDEHVMLFAGWVDKSAGEATIIEESDCGLVALTKTLKMTISDESRTPLLDGTGRVFYAIRHGK